MIYFLCDENMTQYFDHHSQKNKVYVNIHIKFFIIINNYTLKIKKTICIRGNAQYAYMYID